MSGNTASPLVLILTNDHSAGLILTKRLESFGCKTDLLDNENAVLDFVKNAVYVPDLILVNFIREDSPLLDLPNHLKKESRWGDSVPCAAYSALHDRSFIVKVLESGFVDYILRPIELDLFRDRVEKLTKRSVTLSSDTYRRPMSETAHLNLDAHLIQLNEFGLVIKSSKSIPPGIVFSLTSSTLDRILGAPVKVRSVGNRQLSVNDFETTLIFVALDSSQARQLRKFALGPREPQVA